MRRELLFIVKRCTHTTTHNTQHKNINTIDIGEDNLSRRRSKEKKFSKEEGLVVFS